MPIRAFLDANVLFSASREDSNMGRMLERLIEAGQAISSDAVMQEAERNLVAKRPAWLDVFYRFGPHVIIVAAAKMDLGISLDEKDYPLLCAAVEARCDYFVTGDRKDFSHLYDRQIHGVEIVTPLRFSELLSKATC